MMQVICVLPEQKNLLPSLAESCLSLSPQIALGSTALFVEVSASRKLFSLEECLRKVEALISGYGIKAKFAWASDIPSSLAFAHYGMNHRENLPIEALAFYLSPFAPEPFAASEIFQRLGVRTIKDFFTIPRKDIASRLGKEGALAHHKFLQAEQLAWPRFVPTEKVNEMLELDFPLTIESLDPLFFLLKNILQRTFFRLTARGETLVSFQLTLLLHKSCAPRNIPVRLPLPQSDPQKLLSFLQERLQKELELRPLAGPLEALSLLVEETAPATNKQKDFFSRQEEEKEAWSSLLARLLEKLGQESSFLAIPQPRILPEASWKKSPLPEKGIAVQVPPRPLRLFSQPLPLRWHKNELQSQRRSWKVFSHEGPEILSGEWWKEEFHREYFKVETQEETLWIFRNPKGLFLHGIFD